MSIECLGHEKTCLVVLVPSLIATMSSSGHPPLPPSPPPPHDYDDPEGFDPEAEEFLRRQLELIQLRKKRSERNGVGSDLGFVAEQPKFAARRPRRPCGDYAVGQYFCRQFYLRN